MKNLIILICLVALVAGGCASSKNIDGKTYEPYGVFNQDSHKDPSILYEVSFGSVAVAIIFSETLIAPVYVVGWCLWEPVRKIKGLPGKDGTIGPAGKDGK